MGETGISNRKGIITQKRMIIALGSFAGILEFFKTIYTLKFQNNILPIFIA
jgi:hypothetical protein